MEDQKNVALLWGLNLNNPTTPVNLDLAPSTGTQAPDTAKVDGHHHWYHLHSDHPECEPLLLQLGLDPHIAAIMTATETRPRVLPYGTGVLLILRGVNTNPGADVEDMVSLRIWFDQGLVVSTRKATRQLLAARDTKEAILAGSGPTSAPELLLQIIERMTNRITTIVAQFEDELDDIESSIESGETSTIRHHLTETRRQIVQIRRYVAPQREALTGLINLRSPLLQSVEHLLREQTDKTTRLVEDLELAREKAVLLQEELRNQIAEAQNQRMYVLSLVTAIFLPLSFLTGVFGMNVAGLPGTEYESAFTLLAAGMLVVAAISLIWMKSKRWF